VRPFFGEKALFCLKKRFKKGIRGGCFMEIEKLLPLNGVGNDRSENRTSFPHPQKYRELLYAVA